MIMQYPVRPLPTAWFPGCDRVPVGDWLSGVDAQVLGRPGLPAATGYQALQRQGAACNTAQVVDLYIYIQNLSLIWMGLVLVFSVKKKVLA